MRITATGTICYHSSGLHTALLGKQQQAFLPRNFSTHGIHSKPLTLFYHKLLTPYCSFFSAMSCIGVEYIPTLSASPVLLRSLTRHESVFRRRSDNFEMAWSDPKLYLANAPTFAVFVVTEETNVATDACFYDPRSVLFQKHGNGPKPAV